MTLFERSSKELQEGLHNGEYTIADLTNEAFTSHRKTRWRCSSFFSFK